MCVKYKILIEGEQEDLGFFITYSVIARNKEEAIKIIFSDVELEELKKMNIEEIIVDETTNIHSSTPRIVEKTGRVYFPLEEE